MKTKPRPADIYFRFLHLAQAIRGLPDLPWPDPLEERMLQFIATARQRQERLSVRDLMRRAELGSPATLHSRLKSLRSKGWVVLGDTEDSRRKQVELSSAALAHFDQLSKLLLKAVQST